MAKRVFEIAKELGIKSKAIVEKCEAEGIPKTAVKNHMSSISPGLEASIREWFSGNASSTTAVETAEHVDLERVRAKPRTKTAKAASKKTTDEGEGGVAVAEAEQVEAPKAKPTAASSPSDDNGDTTSNAPAAKTPTPEPSQQEDKSEPQAQQETPSTDTDTAQPAQETPSKEARPAASKNDPKKPETITPAGPQLGKRAPVKMAGPKVVRVEAPERFEPPRRRPPSGPPRGPRGGGGAGGPGGPSPDFGDADRSRSPRRATKNTRSGRGVSSRRTGHRDESLGTGMIREQDLVEREARLQRAGGYLKKRRHEMKMRQSHGGAERATTAAQTGGVVKIQAPFTIKDLSSATGVKGSDIVKKLFLQDRVMATINSGIDTEKAQEIMLDYNIELEITEAKTAEQVVSEQFDTREATDAQPRSPIITILGHVDHGKTSLLDRIRNENVAEGEAGGITQATSAFRVPLELGGETKHVVFLDTPGHEAFTEMRARGANVTDIVVLVVAADDGVMPQTIESINHAKAAGVPIVVALNKIDKPEATEDNIQKIYGQLAEHGLNPTAWGGDIEVVKTSATKGTGIDDLLEILDLQGQMLEITADFAGPARGMVIESKLEEGRGATATIIVLDGQLKVGDFIVVGPGFGRVRDIVDDRGNRLDSAGPAQPVQISGFDQLPAAGDKFFIVSSLKQAQQAAEQRRQRDREAQLAVPKVTLDTLFTQMAESDLKEIRVVVKADVQGSIDVLKKEIEDVSTSEVKVRVLHAAVGGITESDVLLADASGAIIIGFNVIPTGKARSLAEEKQVEIRAYRVIYEITDDIRKAAEGLLEPEIKEEILGHAEVRAVFKISRVGNVAGCYVTDGVVQRDALIRVTRDGVVIEHDRTLEQLKRVKEDAKEVRSNTECGMKIVGYDDIKEGDVLECYKKVSIKRTL